MYLYKVTLTTEVILQFEEEPTEQEIMDEAPTVNGMIVHREIERLQ